MKSTEQKKQLEVLGIVTDRFNSQYKLENYGKTEAFTTPNGTIFNVCAFPGEYALVIEYAENAEDAAAGRFEDGDRFYLDEYCDFDELIEAMKKEIGT